MTDRAGIDVVYQENRVLREEIERLRSGHDEAVKQHNMIIDHYKQRIEELESRDIGEDIQEFNHAHGVYEITTEQIDAAWRYWKPYDPTKREALIFQTLGIVACEECGGSGERDRSMYQPNGDPTDPTPDECPYCCGHGWKVVSDE